METRSTANKTNRNIVMMSRIRLARNLADEKFPNSANKDELERIYKTCVNALLKSGKLKRGKIFNMGNLSDFNRELLLEDRRISKELLSGEGTFRGVVISGDNSVAAMINEEDHLRIQAFARGNNLAGAWKTANFVDDNIEQNLEYAFCREFGYQTACPTNVGTGMRASLMMHLPALVMADTMEKIVRGVNQLGLIVRGANGEGSDSYSSIFQLSNQQTLGLTETEIIDKITRYGGKIAGFETNARLKLLQDNPLILADKFSRARAILENCKLISTAEAMTNLSILRMAADMDFFELPDILKKIDGMMVDIQPSHLRMLSGVFNATSSERDSFRASYLNSKVRGFGAMKIPT